MGLLKTYSIIKVATGSFQLDFETEKDVVVNYSYDPKTNVNSVNLKSGNSTTLAYKKNFKSVNGKLQVSFFQDTGTKMIGGGDPDIIITDDE